MVIEVPYPVMRSFIIKHRELVFVYGNDYFNKGCLGAAWQCANEPNSFPVPVCMKLCPSSSEKYFTDEFFDRYRECIDERIREIPLNKGPIIVLPKLGLGNAQMKLRAPKLYQYLWSQLNKIQTQNLKWI